MTRAVAISQHNPQGQFGLSLLELLVAFAILGMSIGLLYRSLGGSVRSVADMTSQQEAAMVAQSVLALRDAVTAEGWNAVGTSGRYQWEVRSAPFKSDVLPEFSGLTAGAAADRLPLQQIQLLVRWGEGDRPHQIEIMTLLPERKPFPGEVVR